MAAVPGLESAAEAAGVAGQAGADEVHDARCDVRHCVVPAAKLGLEARRLVRPRRRPFERVLAARAAGGVGADVEHLLAVALLLGQLAVVIAPRIVDAAQVTALGCRGKREIAAGEGEYRGHFGLRNAVANDLEEPPVAAGVPDALASIACAEVDDGHSAERSPRRDRSLVEVVHSGRRELVVELVVARLRRRESRRHCRAPIAGVGRSALRASGPVG